MMFSFVVPIDHLSSGFVREVHAYIAVTPPRGSARRWIGGLENLLAVPFPDEVKAMAVLSDAHTGAGDPVFSLELDREILSHSRGPELVFQAELTAARQTRTVHRFDGGGYEAQVNVGARLVPEIVIRAGIFGQTPRESLSFMGGVSSVMAQRMDEEMLADLSRLETDANGAHGIYDQAGTLRVSTPGFGTTPADSPNPDEVKKPAAPAKRRLRLGKRGN